MGEQERLRNILEMNMSQSKSMKTLSHLPETINSTLIHADLQLRGDMASSFDQSRPPELDGNNKSLQVYDLEGAK